MRPLIKLPAHVQARYERRNAKRRKVHLANGDFLAACGCNVALIRGVTLVTTDDYILRGKPEPTCATCRAILAKGGGL